MICLRLGSSTPWEMNYTHSHTRVLPHRSSPDPKTQVRCDTTRFPCDTNCFSCDTSCFACDTSCNASCLFRLLCPLRHLLFRLRHILCRLLQVGDLVACSSLHFWGPVHKIDKGTMKVKSFQTGRLRNIRSPVGIHVQNSFLKHLGTKVWYKLVFQGPRMGSMKKVYMNPSDVPPARTPPARTPVPAPNLAPAPASTPARTTGPVAPAPEGANAATATTTVPTASAATDPPPASAPAPAPAPGGGNHATRFACDTTCFAGDTSCVPATHTHTVPDIRVMADKLNLPHSFLIAVADNHNNPTALSALADQLERFYLPREVRFHRAPSYAQSRVLAAANAVATTTTGGPGISCHLFRL